MNQGSWPYSEGCLVPIHIVKLTCSIENSLPNMSEGMMAATSSIVRLPLVGGSTVTEGELVLPKDRRTQELVIALIGPVASGCTKARDILTSVLENQYNYKVVAHKPSKVIADSAKLISETLSDELWVVSGLLHTKKQAIS